MHHVINLMTSEKNRKLKEQYLQEDYEAREGKRKQQEQYLQDDYEAREKKRKQYEDNER